MGAARTSNKDILEAISAQTDAINALVGAIAGQRNTPPAGIIDTTPVTDSGYDAPTEVPGSYTDTGPAQVKVPAGYMTHQRSKAQDHATAKGERVVLYARHNLNGETKLAYCLASRWSSLRDNGLIGAIATFDPK